MRIWLDIENTIEYKGQYLKKGSYLYEKRKRSNRGAGGHYFCKECNSNTTGYTEEKPTHLGSPHLVFRSLLQYDFMRDAPGHMLFERQSPAPDFFATNCANVDKMTLMDALNVRGETAGRREGFSANVAHKSGRVLVHFSMSAQIILTCKTLSTF